MREREEVLNGIRRTEELRLEQEKLEMRADFNRKETENRQKEATERKQNVKLPKIVINKISGK